MADDSNDPVKKIFGKTAEEIFAPKTEAEKKQDHSKFHSANAFCGFAGPEEMKHFYWLMKKLTDKQVKQLCERVGIKALGGGLPDDRETLESWIEEADREDFYREYHRLLKS